MTGSTSTVSMSIEPDAPEAGRDLGPAVRPGLPSPFWMLQENDFVPVPPVDSCPRSRTRCRSAAVSDAVTPSPRCTVMLPVEVVSQPLALVRDCETVMLTLSSSGREGPTSTSPENVRPAVQVGLALLLWVLVDTVVESETAHPGEPSPRSLSAISNFHVRRRCPR